MFTFWLIFILFFFSKFIDTIKSTTKSKNIFVSAIELDQNLLIQEYGFGLDSIEIDLSGKNIEIIDINTFKGFENLEKLYLQENKLMKLEQGLFYNLSNLKELWLESNRIESVDKNIFVGLEKLKKVCLDENPISFKSPNNFNSLCETNPLCSIKINEKCTKDKTSIKIILLLLKF